MNSLAKIVKAKKIFLELWILTKAMQQFEEYVFKKKKARSR